MVIDASLMTLLNFVFIDVFERLSGMSGCRTMLQFDDDLTLRAIQWGMKISTELLLRPNRNFVDEGCKMRMFSRGKDVASDIDDNK